MGTFSAVLEHEEDALAAAQQGFAEHTSDGVREEEHRMI